MATHWIDSATIDGFRNLRNLRLEGLGSVNIFVGENNSGKTSVLEALSILANYNDPSEWLAMVGRRDFGRLDETRAQSIRWCFDKSRLDFYCEMGWKGDIGSGSLGVLAMDFASHIDYPGDDRVATDVDMPEVRRGVTLIHRLKIDNGSRQSNEEFEQPRLVVYDDEAPRQFNAEKGKAIVVKTETLNPYSFQINHRQVRRLSENTLGHSVRPILQLIQEFDSEVTDIQIASTRGMRASIYLKHNRIGTAPLSIFGDALRRALLLATTMLSFEKGGILFIDEIETGIHVHALQRVFAWLSKVAAERNIQIFATTHSLEALDAIAFSTPEATERVVAFQLRQTHAGTVAKRFDGDLLVGLRRERGLDVR